MSRKERRTCRLMARGEIRKRLGLTDRETGALISSEGFPDPCDVLSLGRIWNTADVEAWIREHRPDKIRASS